MKICFLPDFSIDNKTVNDPSLECIFAFSQQHPQKSPFFDWLTVVFMSLFFIINGSFAITFLVLKRQGKILSQFKDAYLIITTISSFFHVISVFMTYGFFWPTLNDHIVEHTCSMWNFWFQWFLGFGIWISILCVRIFSIAQTTIPKLIHSDPRIVIFQRLMLFFVMLGIIIVIGIIAEVTRSFYIDEKHHCVTRFYVKMLILAWIIIMIAFLSIISYIIKKQSLIDDDSHLLNMELKIIKTTTPILITCIILNFTGLTIYGLVRFIFIMLIIAMYVWASMVIYINHVVLYYCGKYQIISVMLENLNINPNKKYALITEDSDTYLQQNMLTNRDQFTDDEDFGNNVLNDESSASLLLQSNPFMAATSSSIPTLSSSKDLESVNMDKFDDKMEIMKMIKTNSDCLHDYCEKLIKLCDIEYANTNNRKMTDFDVFNSTKGQFETHDIVLKFLLQMFIEFQEAQQMFVLRQITYQVYIKKVIAILCKYITTDLHSEFIPIEDGASRQAIDLTLSNLKFMPIVPVIIYKIKAYKSTSQQNDEYPTSLMESINEFYTLLLDKIVDDFFNFWQDSDGFKDLKEGQNQRKIAMNSYNKDVETMF